MVEFMGISIDLRAFTPAISDRDLQQLCADNPETRFETDREGKLIAMSPTGSNSGKLNMSLAAQVWYWNQQYKLGVVFDSSTGFKLSNGAIRSPDVSWIKQERWNDLTPEEQRGFAPIDPDFVIELMSPTDDLDELQQKMSEYIDCGIKLGWLINPDSKQVEIYRPSQDKEVRDCPTSLNGENILPELILDLTEIF